MPRQRHEFKSRFYLVWTLIIGMIFGVVVLALSCVILVFNQPVWIKACLLFMLIVLALAATAAPYSCAACRVTEQGIEVPESRCTDPVYVNDIAEILIFLPVMVFEAMFLPNYRLIPWDSIESVCIEKKMFGQKLVLAIDLEGKSKSYVVSWPLVDTARFIETIRRLAPLESPIYQLTQK